MVWNAVHNAFLNKLTMGTTFPGDPAAFQQRERRRSHAFPSKWPLIFPSLYLRETGSRRRRICSAGRATFDACVPPGRWPPSPRCWTECPAAPSSSSGRSRTRARSRHRTRRSVPYSWYGSRRWVPPDQSAGMSSSSWNGTSSLTRRWRPCPHSVMWCSSTLYTKQTNYTKRVLSINHASKLELAGIQLQRVSWNAEMWKCLCQGNSPIL